MSAFTIAFQVPNLVRSLFADAAIQAAFVPVFTEKLETGERREAFRLASTLIFLVALVLGALTALFILLAPVVMPLFVPALRDAVDGPDGQPLALPVPDPRPARASPGWSSACSTATTASAPSRSRRSSGTSRSSPCWSASRPAFPEEDEIYAYAIGVLAGTVVQLAILAWDLRNTPFGSAVRCWRRLRFERRWRLDVRRVLILMLPVTISLGLINFNLLINSTDRLPGLRAGAGGDRQGVSHLHAAAGDLLGRRRDRPLPDPRALRRPGRLDGLRSTMANGMRQILLLLIPAAAAILVLSEPMIRLVYERGDFDATATELVSEALFWFAFSLPFNGLFLLLTRTFFSLQRPWVPTAISAGNLAITAVVALAPLRAVRGRRHRRRDRDRDDRRASSAQALVLRRALGRLELGRLTCARPRDRARGRRRSPRSSLLRLGRARRGCSGAGSAARSISLGVALAAGAARLRAWRSRCCGSPRRPDLALVQAPLGAGSSASKRRLPIEKTMCDTGHTSGN